MEKALQINLKCKYSKNNFAQAFNNQLKNTERNYFQFVTAGACCGVEYLLECSFFALMQIFHQFVTDGTCYGGEYLHRQKPKVFERAQKFLQFS